jgi:hypothetical protein
MPAGHSWTGRPGIWVQEWLSVQAVKRRAVFLQVNTRARPCPGAFCKTVGSAYVGSNPTPATSKLARDPVHWAGSRALRLDGQGTLIERFCSGPPYTDGQ